MRTEAGRIVVVTGGRAETVTALWVKSQLIAPPLDGIARFVGWALDAWHLARPLARLIEGDATGIDTMARRWADQAGIGDAERDCFPADWTPKPGDLIRYRSDGQPYNPAAGTERNQRMLDELLRERVAGMPVCLLAFPGGRGTADMKRRAHGADVPVWACTFEDRIWRREPKPERGRR